LALLARLGDRARATSDADANWRATRDELEAALDQAALLDVDDGFAFQIGRARPLQGETAASALRFHSRSARRDRLVFTAPEGGPLHLHLFRRRVWYPAVRDSVGEPMRPHDLRHTHVALLIAEGEDPYVISQRLGHASIRTTYDVYGHLFEGRDREAADALEAARERSLSSPRGTRAASAVIGIES